MSKIDLNLGIAKLDTLSNNNIGLFSDVPFFYTNSQKTEFINDIRDILLDLRSKLQVATMKVNFFLIAALSQKTNTKVTSIRLFLEDKKDIQDLDEIQILEAIRNNSKKYSNKYTKDMNDWRIKADELEKEIARYQFLLEKTKDSKLSIKKH